MPRIRYLKPEFFSDEDLAEHPIETRVTFAGLWCYADREGRLEDRPKYLKAMIFPYDDIDIEKQLQSLCLPKRSNCDPFIIRYEAEGQRLIQIVQFHKHQHPHPTERQSILPPTPPLKEKIKIKIKNKIKISVHEGVSQLSNGEVTVKERLKKTDSGYSELFQSFWESYPRKEGKGKAWEEWNKIIPVPDENLLFKMVNTVSKFKNSDQWIREGGKFIPHPSTWLHQKRWDDEVAVVSKLSPGDMWLIASQEKDRLEEEYGKKGQIPLQIGHGKNGADPSDGNEAE